MNIAKSLETLRALLLSPIDLNTVKLKPTALVVSIQVRLMIQTLKQPKNALKVHSVAMEPAILQVKENAQKATIALLIVTNPFQHSQAISLKDKEIQSSNVAQ